MSEKLRSSAIERDQESVAKRRSRQAAAEPEAQEHPQPVEAVELRHAMSEPSRAAPKALFALHGVAGNQAVRRMIQAKLVVGPANDEYEREADQVAEQVVNTTAPAASQRPSPGGSAPVQRQGEEEEVQTKPLLQRQGEEEEVQTKPLLQRQGEEEEVQTKPLLQRQGEEEEVQTKPLLQRQGKEEEVQTKPLLQRQGEEEEVQTKPLLQRQGEEEEVQTKPLLQRQGEEEEVQTKPLLQRQGKEEEVQTKPLLQRQGEEEEVQTKPLLQRQGEEEEVQTKPLLQRQGEEEEVQPKPLLQRQGEEEEVQTKPATRQDGGFDAGSSLESRLEARKGGGAPLAGELRAYMEPRFGADFGDVRLHVDAEAAQMNREVAAQAFTHGKDIYMPPERFDPGSDTGRRLLAHELTHVIQQTGARSPRSKGAGLSMGGVRTSTGPALQRATRWKGWKLAQVLADTEARAAFFTYARANYVGESVDFLDAVEVYRKNGAPWLLKHIYNSYVKAGADKQINVSASTRTAVQQIVESQEFYDQAEQRPGESVMEHDAGHTAFDAAYDAIVSMLENDIYTRYVGQLT